MSRAPGLDLLRAVAIVWVMYYHAQIMDLVPDSDQVARFGWMGVDLFFALSGFLIAGQLLRPFARGLRPNYPKFFARRLLRTLPAYLAVVALYFLIPAVRERPNIQPLWQFLTFTMNLFVDQSTMHSFSSAWSLCVEEHFYLVFPLIVIAFAPRSNKWRLIAALFCIVAFEMAWREDQRQLTEAGAQFTPRVDDDLLFARRGRAGDQYRASGRESFELGPQPRGAQAFEVELGVAGHDDAAWRGAEREETARVVVGLGENEIGRAERFAKKRANVTVAGERPLGDAAVDDCDTRARAMRLDEIVRPQLGLRDQHQRGPDRVEEGAERAAAVERREQMGLRAGKQAPRGVASRGGHRGDDQRRAGPLAYERSHDGAERSDFAH